MDDQQADPYATIAKPVGGADPYASVAKPLAAPAAQEKSLLDRAIENFHNATQGAQPGDGAIKSAVENFGAGAADNLRALAHPIDTLSGIAHAVVHPVDTVEGMARGAIANPARFAGNIGGGLLMGEGVGALAKVAAPAVASAGGRALLLGKTPEAAYESALKPSVTLSPAERAGIVKTGLEQGIPIAKSGLEKLGDKIEALNQAIKDEIGKDPNRPIDPNKVATRADAARARFATQVNAQPDLNAIEASRNQFLQEQGQPQLAPGVSGPPSPAPQMAASDAQAMKQGTYRVLNGKFGEQGSASVEAQKSLARGLKEEIATAFPEVSKLNADESRLLDLQPALERAVNRISNHQAVGIGTPIAGAAAKAVTGSGIVGGAASVMKAVLDNPGIKSRLAIAVSRGAKIPYAQALFRVGAYSASLGATADAPQASTSDGNPNQPTSSQP